MSKNRDHARPLLSTVNDCLIDLIREVLIHASFNEKEQDKFVTSWEAILDKYDLNYRNKQRWNVKDE